MAIIEPISKLTPLICAMNIPATASYRAVPSILIVAPIGKTKRETRGSIPFFSSMHFIVKGNVAELKIEEAIY